MDVFVWNSLYETGLEQVDEQHHKLVDLINELGQRIGTESGCAQSMATLFKTLLHYARKHFEDEERLMADSGVDEQHVSLQHREHRDFVHEIARLIQIQSTRPDAEFETLHRYLISWLGFHILGSDFSMARQIKRIQAGTTPAAALLQEQTSADPSVLVLQDALHNLYTLVADQNKLLQASNTALESKIAERTQALEKANARLLSEQQELQSLNKQLAQAHSKMLQSEKMMAIGQLAAGVAHEINNPVGFVNSNMGTLKTYVERMLSVLDAYADLEQTIPAGPALTRLHALKQSTELEYVRQDVVDLLEESSEGLERVTKIVQDLKDFSHVDDSDWCEADINHGLDSTLNMVWNEVKYKAKVIKDYGEFPKLNCMASQINQVFMNLIVNASHAIDNMGTITLRTWQENDQIMVEISDTGQGMSLEVQRRIFEPFFTTKPVGKGTGLGLSLSYDIVKKHGGHIDVSSELGKGTRFLIGLPLNQNIRMTAPNECGPSIACQP